MKRSSKDITMPDVELGLRYLGEYIRVARKRRKMTMTEVSDRLNIGYQTVVRIEKGDPGVSAGAYMSVLWLFGLDRQFVQSVHPDQDESGKALELSRLPSRVGSKRTTRSEHDF
jgi:transcriptional regulator with XRE-family HTH domain